MMKTIKAISVLLCIFLSVTLSWGQNPEAITAEEVIASVIDHTASAPVPNTVDVFKAGDPQTPVTGIVTTMFATMDVLKKAADLNCNLIIAHEPLFYNHRDETEQFESDPVFLEKKKFIDDNKLVIWRFHDYIHRIQPDAINEGMTIKLGWQKYLANDNHSRFTVPETTLGELLKTLKKVFPQNAFNVIGDPDMKLTAIAFSAGAPGSAAHYPLLRDEDVDVIIAGEVQQWETYEYVRDAVIQGRKKAIIFLGHVTSEEPGMEYCAEWLKGFIKDIPVHFVESGPSYWTW